MSPIHVRIAGPEDLATIVRFNAAMAMETESLRLEPSVLERGVAAVLHDPAKGFYLVAEQDGRVAGQLMITHEWSDWRSADWWWIQSVYVEPELRRGGVLRALYQEVVHRSRRESVHGLRLYVESKNHRAQAAYTRLGMKQAKYLLFELGDE
jgi:L-amino acid N-acyltransferase YncA